MSLRGSNGATRRRHDEGVSVVYDACNHLPIRTAVDPYAHPTLVTDVRRSKESQWVFVDERLPQTRGHCEPDRDVLGAVMMCIHLGEDLPDSPRKLTPGDLFGHPWQRKADPPQTLDGAILCLRVRPLERVLPDVGGPLGQRSTAHVARHAPEVPGGYSGCYRDPEAAPFKPSANWTTFGDSVDAAIASAAQMNVRDGKNRPTGS